MGVGGVAGVAGMGCRRTDVAEFILQDPVNAEVIILLVEVAVTGEPRHGVEGGGEEKTVCAERRREGIFKCGGIRTSQGRSGALRRTGEPG